jgi:hypothetical protein
VAECSAWLLLRLGLEHRQHQRLERDNIGQHIYTDEGELGVSRIRREPRTLRYEVFKSNIAQQLKSKKAQIKIRILKGLSKSEVIRLDYWCNMVEHTRDPKKIEQANVMRGAWKCVKKNLTFGRSEGEVRVWLVSTLAIAIPFFNVHRTNTYESNK